MNKEEEVEKLEEEVVTLRSKIVNLKKNIEDTKTFTSVIENEEKHSRLIKNKNEENRTSYVMRKIALWLGVNHKRRK
jgi:hypothetical protein